MYHNVKLKLTCRSVHIEQHVKRYWPVAVGTGAMSPTRTREEEMNETMEMRKIDHCKPTPASLPSRGSWGALAAGENLPTAYLGRYLVGVLSSQPCEVGLLWGIINATWSKTAQAGLARYLTVHSTTGRWYDLGI